MGSPLLVVAVRVNLWDIMNEGPCVSSFNGSSTEIPQWWFVLLMNKVLSDKVQPRSDVWQVLGPASALDLSAVFLCFCQACSDLALSVGVLDPEARTGKLWSSRTKSLQSLWSAQASQANFYPSEVSTQHQMIMSQTQAFNNKHNPCDQRECRLNRKAMTFQVTFTLPD